MLTFLHLFIASDDAKSSCDVRLKVLDGEQPKYIQVLKKDHSWSISGDVVANSTNEAYEYLKDITWREPTRPSAILCNMQIMSLRILLDMLSVDARS